MNATPTLNDLDLQAIIEGRDQFEQRSPQGRLPGDETLHIKFSRKPVLSTIKTQEAGRPIYDDYDFVTIFIPGDDRLVLDSLMTPEMIRRFRPEYEAWKRNEAAPQTGTPLEHWGRLTPSQIAELKYLNVHTVEALAAMSDGIAQRFMGGAHTLRQAAKAWLQAAGDAAVVEKQQAELAKRDEELAELRKMVEELVKKDKKKPESAN